MEQNTINYIINTPTSEIMQNSEACHFLQNYDCKNHIFAEKNDPQFLIWYLNQNWYFAWDNMQFIKDFLHLNRENLIYPVFDSICLYENAEIFYRSMGSFWDSSSIHSVLTNGAPKLLRFLLAQEEIPFALEFEDWFNQDLAIKIEKSQYGMYHTTLFDSALNSHNPNMLKEVLLIFKERLEAEFEHYISKWFEYSKIRLNDTKYLPHYHPVSLEYLTDYSDIKEQVPFADIFQYVIRCISHIETNNEYSELFWKYYQKFNQNYGNYTIDNQNDTNEALLKATLTYGNIDCFKLILDSIIRYDTKDNIDYFIKQNLSVFLKLSIEHSCDNFNNLIGLLQDYHEDIRAVVNQNLLFYLNKYYSYEEPVTSLFNLIDSNKIKDINHTLSKTQKVFNQRYLLEYELNQENTSNIKKMKI